MARSPDAHDEDEAAAVTSKRQKDRQARKYGFACANCRKRKVKCDGGLPSCRRCTANRETCCFNKGPSVAYSLALQNRLNACELLLDRLRRANDTERLRILEEHFGNDVSKKRKRPANTEGPPPDSPQSEQSAADDEMIDLCHETTVDEDGRICFYGTTSFFHLNPEESTVSCVQPPQGTPEAMLASPDQTSPSAWSLDAPSPAPRHGAQRDIKSYLNVDISTEACNELLETYWCWPHNIHLVLCRKIFMRDLVNSGPYVTPFLLSAVLAQAARYSDRLDAAELGAYFSQRTVNEMAVEIAKGSSIPTLQGMLIFAGLECTIGRSSQGWLYLGMAIRMMQDMGIHINNRKLIEGQFSQLELAMRQQILWSCYTCDKAVSLCLGRAPMLHDTVPLPTADSMLDGEDVEEEPWTPRFATISALESGVVQKAKTNSRFVAYCQLCVIIDDVLKALYYSKAHPATHSLQSFLDSSITKLDEWARNLPSHLYVREDCHSIPCPPLHILILNLLYHTTIILLCRPYRSRQPRAREMATSAAEMIDRLFMLHIRRFGFRIITYLEIYTMFVASTINILDCRDNIDKERASARLALNLEVLRIATGTRSSTGCFTSAPSIARCVKIIEQLLRKDEKGNEEGRLQQRRSADSAAGTQAVGVGIGSAEQQQDQSPSTDTARHPYLRPQDLSPAASLSFAMPPTSLASDLDFLTNQDMSGIGDWLPFFNDDQPFFGNDSTLSEIMPPQGGDAAMQGEILLP